MFCNSKLHNTSSLLCVRDYLHIYRHTHAHHLKESANVCWNPRGSYYIQIFAKHFNRRVWFNPHIGICCGFSNLFLRPKSSTRFFPTLSTCSGQYEYTTTIYNFYLLLTTHYLKSPKILPSKHV